MMKKETKIIIIGIVSTLIALILAITIFYFIVNNNNDKENNTEANLSNEVSNENNDNINQDTSKDQENPNSSTSTPNEEKTVTVYLFRGSGCPHCEHAIEYFKTILSSYPYLEVKAYEVWYNSENKELMNAVSEELELGTVTSVPLIIIGKDYQLRGYSSNYDETIKEEIEKAYQDENYEDIVEKVLENNSDINILEETIN